MTNDTLLTSEEVANRLGISAKTLATWRCEGRDILDSVKVGSRIRYRSSDVERFIADGDCDGGSHNPIDLEDEELDEDDDGGEEDEEEEDDED